jgi:SseB protein N-terminal domain
MSEDFEPRNELEKSLLAAQNEEISSEDLLNILMNSQVFMPVQDEKPSLLNIQRSARAQPLVLNAEDGTPILVLFSSPERAKDFMHDYPGFGGGILSEFTWVLERMGRDFGIALNPGHDVGFDMEPETVNELVDNLGQKARH